jgi:hypothetical protein
MAIQVAFKILNLDSAKQGARLFIEYPAGVDLIEDSIDIPESGQFIYSLKDVAGAENLSVGDLIGVHIDDYDGINAEDVMSCYSLAYVTDDGVVPPPEFSRFIWNANSTSYAYLTTSVNFTGSLIAYYRAPEASVVETTQVYLFDGEEGSTRIYTLFDYSAGKQRVQFNSSSVNLYIDDIEQVSQSSIVPKDGNWHKIEIVPKSSANFFSIACRFSFAQPFNNELRDIVVTGITGGGATTLSIPLADSYSESKELKDSEGSVIGTKYDFEVDYTAYDTDGNIFTQEE